MTVSSSQGRIVWRSISSQLIPSSSFAILQTSRKTCTWVPHPTTVTSEPEIRFVKKGLICYDKTDKNLGALASTMVMVGKASLKMWISTASNFSLIPSCSICQSCWQLKLFGNSVRLYLSTDRVILSIYYYSSEKVPFCVDMQCSSSASRGFSGIQQAFSTDT